MTERILEILDNVKYWDTCPEDYKKDIETFLDAQKQALRIHDAVGRSEQLQAFEEWYNSEYSPNIHSKAIKQYLGIL